MRQDGNEAMSRNGFQSKKIACNVKKLIAMEHIGLKLKGMDFKETSWTVVKRNGL